MFDIVLSELFTFLKGLAQMWFALRIHMSRCWFSLQLYHGHFQHVESDPISPGDAGPRWGGVGEGKLFYYLGWVGVVLVRAKASTHRTHVPRVAGEAVDDTQRTIVVDPGISDRTCRYGKPTFQQPSNTLCRFGHRQQNVKREAHAPTARMAKPRSQDDQPHSSAWSTFQLNIDEHE